MQFHIKCQIINTGMIERFQFGLMTNRSVYIKGRQRLKALLAEIKTAAGADKRSSTSGCNDQHFLARALIELKTVILWAEALRY